MQPNILLHEPPTSVRVKDIDVPIRTSHRIWIRIMQLTDDPTIDVNTLYVSLLHAAYSAESIKLITDKQDAALEAALSFFNFNEPKRPQTMQQRRKAAIRSWDWDWDAQYVIADFQREYAIDISDPATKMHWWRFWSLFRSLSDTSATMQVIGTRTADDSGLSPQQKRDLRERKQALMFPARTAEEVEKNRIIRWGQDV